MYVLSATGVNLVSATTLNWNPLEISRFEVSVAVAAPQSMVRTGTQANLREELFKAVEAELNAATADAVITVIVGVVAGRLGVLIRAVLRRSALDSSVAVTKCDQRPRLVVPAATALRFTTSKMTTLDADTFTTIATTFVHATMPAFTSYDADYDKASEPSAGRMCVATFQ